MFLGIDVSKKTLDVALLSDHPKPRHKVFANDAAGHQELLNWLTKQEAEAVHPAQIHAFGRSGLKRTKTDKTDALLIARFCQMHQPPVWKPLAPQVEQLQGLVRRLEHLEEMLLMEENRLGSGGIGEPVKESLEEHISYLKGQIEKTRRHIKDHIDQNPDLKSQSQLLESIPGIGATTAALLLAELGDVTHFNSARQVAAFAGLVPRLRESGTSVRGRSRLSKIGSSRLRKALYFPAITALRFNPLIKAFGLRLSAQGKSKMLIVGAAMRKLLHLAYGVMKSGRPFDPNFCIQNP
jgi:transposase